MIAPNENSKPEALPPGDPRRAVDNLMIGALRPCSVEKPLADGDTVRLCYLKSRDPLQPLKTYLLRYDAKNHRLVAADWPERPA